MCIRDRCKAAGFDLVIVETSGIGQGSSGITDVSDVHVYVMTPEYGAASQLEKIDMLDFADIVIINKFDRRGAEDALRDVSKQVQRNRQAFDQSPDTMPVYGTIAAQYNDLGVDSAYLALMAKVDEFHTREHTSSILNPGVRCSPPQLRIIPPGRLRYLGDIVDSVRGYHSWVDAQADGADAAQHLTAASSLLAGDTAQALLAEGAKQSEALDAPTRAALQECCLLYTSPSPRD